MREEVYVTGNYRNCIHALSVELTIQKHRTELIRYSQLNPKDSSRVGAKLWLSTAEFIALEVVQATFCGQLKDT